jgi:hypothetical protein
VGKNTGEGYRRGQVRDRYQQYNERTDRYDKYDGDGNYVDSKSTPGPFQERRGAGTEEAASRLNGCGASIPTGCESHRRAPLPSPVQTWQAPHGLQPYRRGAVRAFQGAS